MRFIAEFLIGYFFRFILWFRYKVTYKGLENLNAKTLNKPGGVLFLPNHPAVFVDPVLTTLGIIGKFPIRPLVIEYMYYNPAINWLMRFVKAIPVPNFETSGNSLKRSKNEKAIQTVVEGLKQKDNFLIYPGGGLKQTAREVLGGNSGVYRILQGASETNVVLVRVKGLWGSSFSRALTGATPNMFKVVTEGIKSVLKNLLFFTPRRQVIIEYEVAPADLPIQGSRLEFNRYLEHWYNRPDGLTQQEGEYPGDSLIFVSTSMWGEVYPKITAEETKDELDVDMHAISPEIQKNVLNKLQEMTHIQAEKIHPDMALSSDLGLDSLDISEIQVYLKDQFSVDAVPFKELTTVRKLMAIASKQIVCKEQVQEEYKDFSKWNKKVPKAEVNLAPGETIPEVFLNQCAKQGKAIACADERSGILTYSQLKMRALLLASYIQKLPGKRIGIMLPASVPAYVAILATQIAGKIPVLINWTVGARHLESVLQLANLEVVLSSWAFIDKLQNADLAPIENKLILLEDVRHEFSLTDKLKALWLSKRGTQAILKKFNTQNVKKDDEAVLLFTSGTESLPKGVPLTHENLLSNQREIFSIIKIYSDDIFYGFLPPFHAFGFNICGILCLLIGVRVVYSPDPTNGKELARNVEKWKATITCGAPTFLRGMIKATEPGQLDSLRLCVTGAEKAPPQLFREMEQIGKLDALLEGYGITECSPILTANEVGKPNRGVGKPFPGIEIAIAHPETYAFLPQGEQGLILARGPNVFHGYLNPGLASPFVEIEGKKWYKTGDLGFLDPEGNLFISGRMKRFIKIGAEMVSLPAIEDVLLQTALKKGWSTEEGPILAVNAKEQDGGKAKLFLFTKFPTTLDEVNQALREAGFSNLVRISNLIQLPELPLMGSGKIHYRELEAAYMNTQPETSE
ncbi:AMP-binding protein [Parachlamydia sp. AcF125]|uniref:AMP-binding protein n=1 Tax=Parachlamydia sp. AcF125 TaxID=2795736 RepID=UPI001BC99AD1|nr:Bifunctional protein Aas [Parachlamydia sp. AcF125]